MLTELAPLLMLEIEETRSSAGRNADIQTLAGLEKKIGEIRKKETSAIKDMLGVLDKDQIAQVAAEFRAEREQLQRKIQEVQGRVNIHCDLPDLSSEALSKISNSAIKDALRRSVQWITIGKEGVVVLTSLGTYLSAAIIDIPKGVYRTSETKIRIAPPTPADTLRCLRWLPSPADFIKGRRDSMGARGEELTDEEILPGIGTLYDGVPVDMDKVEVIVEEIHLD